MILPAIGDDMASTTDMNIILGQGNAIKEVHNVRKQSLELNQQFVAQKTEDKKKEDKVKVQEFETDNKIEIRSDEEKEHHQGSKDNEKDPRKEQPEEESDLTKRNYLIDIKV